MTLIRMTLAAALLLAATAGVAVGGANATVAGSDDAGRVQIAANLAETQLAAADRRTRVKPRRVRAQTAVPHRRPAARLGVRMPKPPPPPPGNLSSQQVELYDFYCGGSYVPCDQTFKDFCAKIAGGTYQKLPSGHGACITPGGWNPDGSPN